MKVLELNAFLADMDAQFPGFYDNTGFPWLEAYEISEIILSSDESLYPDETMQIRFDTNNELLFTRRGNYVEGIFVPISIRNVIDLDIISGFQLKSRTSVKSPYKFGSAV